MKKLSRRKFVELTAASAGALLAAGCGLTDENTDSGESTDATGLDGTVEDSTGQAFELESLPVMAETDVLVVGGGPAGLAAAIGAAQAGAKTLLVERYGFYGGVITQAIMGSITWWRYAQTIDAGGVCAQIEERAKEMGGSIDLLKAVDDPTIQALLRAVAEDSGLVKDGKPTYEILRSEFFKIVADRLVLEAGATPLLHCYVVGAVMEEDTIVGVVTESKSGRQIIRAKRVIDATGDGDVAAFAGAPFSKAENDKLMEVTTNFSVSNVDLVAFMSYVVGENRTMADWVDEDCGKEKDLFSTHLFKVFQEAAAAGEIPKDVVVRAFPGGFCSPGNVLSLNAVHQYGVDCLDVWDLTAAEMEGRRRIPMVMDVFRNRVPGFEKAEVTMIGASLGCRESRKIVGEYALTESDVKKQGRFDDSIGIFPEFLDAYGILCLPTTGRYFQVPYGVTVPQQVENLLVAGRCVSGDRVSYASTRQMGCCMVTGQGAGIAAALSVKDGCTPRSLDIAALQAELAAQGVRIL